LNQQLELTMMIDDDDEDDDAISVWFYDTARQI